MFYFTKRIVQEYEYIWIYSGFLYFFSNYGFYLFEILIFCDI